MSLFTSHSDRQLPFCTQFYQVNLPATDDYAAVLSSELSLFIESARGIMQDRNTVKGLDESLQPPTPTSWEDPFAPMRGDLEQYRAFHRFLHAFLDAIADDTLLNVSFLQELDGWISRYVGAPRYYGHFKNIVTGVEAFEVGADFGAENESVFVHARSLVRGPLPTVGDPVIKAMVQEIMAILGRDDRGQFDIGRCDECNNPFIATASRIQKYCSHRCSHRAGERRRRATKNTAHDID